jgi:hypothetical protein
MLNMKNHEPKSESVGDPTRARGYAYRIVVSIVSVVIAIVIYNVLGVLAVEVSRAMLSRVLILTLWLLYIQHEPSQSRPLWSASLYAALTACAASVAVYFIE